MIYLTCKHCEHLQWTAGIKDVASVPHLMDQDRMRSVGQHQCFEFLCWVDTVGWVTRRATGLPQLSPRVRVLKHPFKPGVTAENTSG